MKRKAFTLLETIIVLAVMTIFFAASIPLFSKFMERAKMDTAARSVASALRTARGQAISLSSNYYLVFDVTKEPDRYFISADGTSAVEKEYKLPRGIWFYKPGAGDPVGEAIEFANDKGCFKSTGELDEDSSKSVHFANGNTPAADYTKSLTVERTTGRVKIN